MTAEEQKQQSQAAWNELAAGYDEFVTPLHKGLAEEALSRADLRSGMRFLDVAAGTGALSLPAARLGARVLATDQAPLMLERLKMHASQEGLDIETRVMDGQALELDDNRFDMAGSQFGVMLFPDMPKGLSEMARIVKPGGRVLLIVFGDASKIEFFKFFVAAVQSAVPGFTGPPMDPPPLPFQLQDPERLRRELAKAGLQDLRVETITKKLEVQSGQHLWNWLTNSNPIVGRVLTEAKLTEEKKAVVRQALDRMVRERSGGSGPAILTHPINIGIGTK